LFSLFLKTLFTLFLRLLWYFRWRTQNHFRFGDILIQIHLVPLLLILVCQLHPKQLLLSQLIKGLAVHIVPLGVSPIESTLPDRLLQLPQIILIPEPHLKHLLIFWLCCLRYRHLGRYGPPDLLDLLVGEGQENRLEYQAVLFHVLCCDLLTGVVPLAGLDELVVDEAEDALVVAAVELELLPAVHQLHLEHVAEVEVTVLGLFLAAVRHDAEALRSRLGAPLAVLEDVNILAVAKPPVVLLLFLAHGVEVRGGRLKGWVILRLNGAVFSMEVELDGLVLLFVELLDLGE
jgi:hypothetical protein